MSSEITNKPYNDEADEADESDNNLASLVDILITTPNHKLKPNSIQLTANSEDNLGETMDCDYFFEMLCDLCMLLINKTVDMNIISENDIKIYDFEQIKKYLEVCSINFNIEEINKNDDLDLTIKKLYLKNDKIIDKIKILKTSYFNENKEDVEQLFYMNNKIDNDNNNNNDENNLHDECEKYVNTTLSDMFLKKLYNYSLMFKKDNQTYFDITTSGNGKPSELPYKFIKNASQLNVDYDINNLGNLIFYKLIIKQKTNTLFITMTLNLIKP